jgi:ribosomal protein S18 acetylase RimI-like enzyme
MVQAVSVHDFSIRTARTADVAMLRDVYRRASLSNDGDRADLLANPDALEFAEAPVHDGRTRVALEDERVVGFATTRQMDSAVELDDLFVDPARMRRGIGHALVVDAAETTRALGVARLEVTANGHALDFYQAAGFQLDGVVQTQFGSGHRMHLDVPA